MTYFTSLGVPHVDAISNPVHLPPWDKLDAALPSIRKRFAVQRSVLRPDYLNIEDSVIARRPCGVVEGSMESRRIWPEFLAAIVQNVYLHIMLWFGDIRVRLSRGVFSGLVDLCLRKSRAYFEGL